MASGVGGLSADRPPCARPSGLRLPRGLWESGLILRSFMACRGDGDLVGGLVLLWPVVEIFREEGREGGRAPDVGAVLGIPRWRKNWRTEAR